MQNGEFDQCILLKKIKFDKGDASNDKESQIMKEIKIIQILIYITQEYSSILLNLLSFV